MASSTDLNQPHWFVLSYLGTHKDALKRLAFIDLPYYAPLLFSQESSKGDKLDYLQFTNYAFIRGTQNHIYKLKLEHLRSFNFLPKTESTDQHHPYVEDEVIGQLQKIEVANEGKIPYMPYSTDVVEGDTIRILIGQFEGMQAKAITKAGSKYRQIVLDIAGKFIIPLCKLKAGEYEITAYSQQDQKKNKSYIATAEDFSFLQQALERFYGLATADKPKMDEDRSKIQIIVARHIHATPQTHLQRIRASVILTIAYTILGDAKEQNHYLEHTMKLLQTDCTEAVKAEVLCKFYGCTLDKKYYDLYMHNHKEMKSSDKTLSEMEKYLEWNFTLHP